MFTDTISSHVGPGAQAVQQVRRTRRRFAPVGAEISCEFLKWGGTSFGEGRQNLETLAGNGPLFC